MGIFGCHPWKVKLSIVLFLEAAAISDFFLLPYSHICKEYSLAAIIISTDGFSMLTSISFPNYTVKRSAVANNQINEFGRLDYYCTPPPTTSVSNMHNNPLFRNMSAQ